MRKLVLVAWLATAVGLSPFAALAQADGGTASDGGVQSDGGPPPRRGFTAVALTALPQFASIAKLELDAVIADDGTLLSAGSVAILVESPAAPAGGADGGLAGGGDGGGNGGFPDGGLAGGGDGGSNGGFPDGGLAGGGDGGGNGGFPDGGARAAVYAAQLVGEVALSGDGGISLPNGGVVRLAPGGVFGLAGGGAAPLCAGDGGVASDGGCFSGDGLRFSLWSANVQLAEGANRISAAAFAGDGGQVFSPEELVVVDTSVPSAVITAPPEGGLAGGVLDLSAAVAASASGVTAVRFSFDLGSPTTVGMPPGGQVPPPAPSGPAVWSAQLEAGALTPGRHVVVASVTNGAGTTGESAPVAFTYVAPPSVRFVQPASGALLFNLQDLAVVAESSGGQIARLVLQAGGATFECPAAAPLSRRSCTWADVDVAALCPPGPGCVLRLSGTAVDTLGQVAVTALSVTVDRRYGILQPRSGRAVEEEFDVLVRPPPGANQARCAFGGLAVKLRPHRGHWRGEVSTKRLRAGVHPLECAFAAAGGASSSARVLVTVRRQRTQHD